MEKDNFVIDNFLLIGSDPSKYAEGRDLKFPFTTMLNFHKLIDHIEAVSVCDDEIKKSLALSILKQYEKIPELHGDITDMELTKKHEKFIDDMMMFVFPSAFWDKQAYAASSPYMDEIFYASPEFSKLLKIKKGNIEDEFNIDIVSYNFGKTISGFVAILARFYGVDLTFDFPLVSKINDPITGLDRYFKMNIAIEFMDMSVKGELKKLTESDIEKIRANIYDLDFVKTMIDPDNFVFRGLIILNAINITDTEILSSIRKDLIEKNTVTSFAGFLKLQHKLKSLLRCPGLLLGLADFPGTTDKLFQYGRKVGNSFLMGDGCLKKCNTIKGSIYEYLLESKRAIIIEDLTKYTGKTQVENELLNQGIKNIFIAPLVYDDKVVGILELGSSEAGQLNMVSALKLREVLPVFALAVDRSREELNNSVGAIIKEKCTAIHPTLEWRFQHAAMNLLQKQNEGLKEEMEEIIFNDVYPLYGLSDIRNSSLQRNDAIRQDLIENLELAKDVFNEAKKSRKLKILDLMIYKIDKRIDSLKFGISSSDEADVLRFLSGKVVLQFDHFKNFDAGVRKAIDRYNSVIDDKLGFVYRRRKNFEESALTINNMIANYLDTEQEKIQEIFPHYFERYKTDGVDHNIYIGSTLVESMDFNKIYLKNLRLWQLLIMCGVVRKSELIKKELSMPLETAHLILVQDSPLSIKFRFDEKKFDVDGAYNIRYEIMKKRIDKAEIKGKEERLTQPGKIAIVFSQNSESQEYLEYIEYMQHNKFLKNEVEELELEELQGIKGLRALRVTVNQNVQGAEEKMTNENIKKAIKKMSVN
ncbi:MAG: GAF domain-containing protein [Ignavibacteria bacterium]